MILDTSAVVAVIFKESGHEVLLQKIANAAEVGIGAPTIAECGIVLSARLGQDARGLLGRFLYETNIVTIPFSEEHFGTAVGAWLKYGKGRHAAGLNFGDCLTYSVAKVTNMPLLFVGDDFPQTDLIIA